MWHRILFLGLLVAVTAEATITVVDPGQGVGTSSFGRNNHMALDSAGNPVVAFVGPGTLNLMVCNDPVCADGDDSAINVLSNLSSTPAYFGFVLNDMDFPVISFYDETNTDLMLIHCLDVKCHLPPQINTITDADDVGEFSDLALDASGFPVIAFSNQTDDDLYLVHCNDAFCAGGDDVPNFLYDVSTIGEIAMSLDATGVPAIAFMGDFNPNLIRCNDVNCAGNNESFQVLPHRGYGAALDMMLDDNGFPVALYYFSGELDLIRCNDVNCDPGVNGPESSSSMSNTGASFALAFDSAGRPVIATRVNSAMTVIRCNDLNCSGNDEIFSTLPGYVGSDVSVVMDALENPVTVGYASPGLRFAHCNDGFCTGNNEDSSYVNSIKLDVGSHGDMIQTGGAFVWSYHDKTSGNFRIRRCDDATCTGFGEVTSVIDGGPSANYGEFNALALTGDNRPVVSYYDRINGSLNLISCHNSDCDTYDDVVIEGTDDAGQYSTLQLDASGNPVVSFYHLTDDRLYLAHCDTPNCISFDNQVNNINWGGQYNDMKLDASGFPVISYYDAFLGSVNLVHCNDANCDDAVNGAESFQEVETGGVGEFTSLVLDPSGFPLFSYFDRNNGSLKVVHCNDANCDPTSNGPESISVVSDGGGNQVGYFTSLAVDTDGFPVISHYDMDDMNLMLVKCRDASCALPTTNEVVAVSGTLLSGYTRLSLNNGMAYITYYNADEKQLEMVELPVPDIIFKDGFD